MHTFGGWEYWFDEATGAGTGSNTCCCGCPEGYGLVCCGYPAGAGCRKFIAAEAAYAIP